MTVLKNKVPIYSATPDKIIHSPLQQIPKKQPLI